MDLAELFPIWDKLTPEQQQRLVRGASQRHVAAGTALGHGSADCTGLLIVASGQLRAYILSDEGRQITIYRLLERDVCLLSASCAMRGMQFAVAIDAEKDSDLWVVAPSAYKILMEESAAVANYTNEVMAGRFSDVMWLMEQIMWRSFDKRLAAFLLDEAALDETTRLKTTHEAIGNHLGTAREVVTRMLRYFQDEGMVKLSRGVVELTDPARLRMLASS